MITLRYITNHHLKVPYHAAPSVGARPYCEETTSGGTRRKPETTANMPIPVTLTEITSQRQIKITKTNNDKQLTITKSPLRHMILD